ncbi:50S ribosomal protein L3 [Candidatus Gracilibacteria bacterium]|nr:MAG: 50S ribosomal protein L3 [Candidatus Gracilibacteria bacterium]
MTRVVKEDKFIPVTLLKVPELMVVGFKTTPKDGYEAIIVGILKKKKEGVLKKGKNTLSKNEFSTIREFRLNEGESDKFKVGDVLSLDLLTDVREVRIESYSKGKGFTGAMKKHNFHGGPAGHGSKFHRALGSIGNRKPTRTHKGKKMHGHHGDVKVVVKTPLEIVNKDMGVIGVRGPVPGGRNSLVNIIF